MAMESVDSFKLELE